MKIHSERTILVVDLVRTLVGYLRSMAAVRAVFAVSLSIILITAVLLPQIVSSGYATPEEPQFKLSAIRAQDTNGNDLGNFIRTGQQIVLTIDATNEGNTDQSFAGMLQINSPDGTVYLSRQIGIASAGDLILFEFTWETEKVGVYTIQAFLWTSLVPPTALSNPSETRMEVGVIPTASADTIEEPVFAQHEGVDGISSTISDEQISDPEQIRNDIMAISGVVGVSVNATHVHVMLEDIESTILVPKQIGFRQVIRDVTGPVCTMSENVTNPCRNAWGQLGNGEYIQMRLLNITGVTSVSFEGTTIVLLVENKNARGTIPDRIFGQTVTIESISQPSPVEGSGISECLSLFSGTATSPYSANSTITIDSMQSSYQADFDYRIAFGDDSDTYDANNIAVDPFNVIFQEKEIISMVLLSNEDIAEGVVSLYQEDVSECDIVFMPFDIPASDKIVLDTLSIEEIEPNSGKYLVKVAIPAKIDVRDNHHKLVIQYMDNDESVVMYVVPNVGIESSE